MLTSSLRRRWLSNVRGDLLAGIVVVIAFSGGRVGMILAAIGATAMLRVAIRFRHEGDTVQMCSPDPASARRLDRFAPHHEPGPVERPTAALKEQGP